MDLWNEIQRHVRSMEAFAQNASERDAMFASFLSVIGSNATWAQRPLVRMELARLLAEEEAIEQRHRKR